MKAKYAAFLPHLSSRADLNRLIQWMCSELAVGHHRVGGGDFLASRPRPGRPARADYAVENGRYRFKKVFGGLNWTPSSGPRCRARLRGPGGRVPAGRRGPGLVPPDNLFAGSRPRRQDRRDHGRPQPRRTGSRRQGRARRRRRALRTATGSRATSARSTKLPTPGRLRLRPNTTTLGHVYFKRYFFPRPTRRPSSSTSVSTGRIGRRLLPRLVEEARLGLLGHALRGRPQDAERLHPGPKVMIINEVAGSGGTSCPTCGASSAWASSSARRPGRAGRHPRLPRPDGRRGVTAPNLAIWTEEGFIVENVGVPPDIEVEQTPRDVIAAATPARGGHQGGHGRAEGQPPAKPKRPAYPVR